MRRAWLSAAMLLAGTSLLVSAGHASETKETKFRQGGTLRIYMPEADGYYGYYIDPSRAYGFVTWHIEQATALNLLSYPDAAAPRGSRLVPEGASSYRVSADGTRYTFTIRKGFRFSDGAKVTARNYAYAINRALTPRIDSPGRWFISDADGSSIVTAEARGSKLILNLARPDGGTLLATLAMPFFQAISLRLPRSELIDTVGPDSPLPSAGPYYVSSWEPSTEATLQRNPYYGGKRTRRLARIEIEVEGYSAKGYEEVRANRADFTYALPPGAPAALGQEFGLNGRFRVRPAPCVQYIAMNTSNPLFRHNPQLRRAVNYVINRKALTERSDAYTYLPTDQYLPIGFPGFENIDAYPFTPDFEKARRLAAGRVPPGGPWPYYYSVRGRGVQRMEIVRASLRLIGIEIEPVGFRNFEPWDLISAAGERNSRHAFASIGSCGDEVPGARALAPQMPDPYDFINPQFDGRTIRDVNNTNIAYFNNPTYNRRMARASKLTGTARNRAYAALEHDLVTKAAPWAVWGVATKRFFFGRSVDMRSFVYQPIYESPPYNLLARK